MEDATLFYGAAVGQPSAATMGGYAAHGWGAPDSGGVTAGGTGAPPSPATKWGTLLWVALMFAVGMAFLHLG